MRSRILLRQGFLALFSPAAAFAQQQPAPWSWPGPWHMWAGWWIFPLIMLLMIAGCIAMILYMHRSGGAGRHPDPSWGDPTRSALQILNERFARGEIRRDEYEERKRAILTMTAPTGNL